MTTSSLLLPLKFDRPGHTIEIWGHMTMGLVLANTLITQMLEHLSRHMLVVWNTEGEIARGASDALKRITTQLEKDHARKETEVYELADSEEDESFWGEVVQAAEEAEKRLP